jgi:mannosyl-3-phosphoglycerate phosphatase
MVTEPTPPLLVATDLDGCLLDETTYSYDEARPALAALAARRIPLVLASSKTRAEMQPLSRTLGLASPLLVENGGALLVPEVHLPRPPRGTELREGFWSIVLGTARAELVRTLEEIAREAGAHVRSFASLAPSEIEALTGLSPPAARLALEREYDEPFLVDDETAGAAIAAAARTRRMQVTRGGRFWHLTGETDKGRALRVLLQLYKAEGRTFSTVALGDSSNDLPLLQAVQRPIVMPRPHGGPDPALLAALPGAELAPRPGPAGWNAAVLAVLNGQRLAGSQDP